MKERVLEEACVAVGEDEAIAVEVVRVVGRVLHHILPESEANGCHTHGTSISQLVNAILLSFDAGEAYPGWPPLNCSQRSAIKQRNCRRARSIVSASSFLINLMTLERATGSSCVSGVIALGAISDWICDSVMLLQDE